MKLIINKKNSGESIALDLELTTTVKELLAILYSYRSKTYDHFSLSEYQEFISVYQCLLYGERFKNKLLPGTKLADYPLEDPCYLTWEELTENRSLSAYIEPISSDILFWQSGKSEIEKEPDISENMKSSIS